MPAIRWLSDISGYFDNAADWKGGVVPGASDGAILKASGSAFTITSNADETIKSVQLGANATLDITGGTFDALTGTGQGANQGANAGVILVGAGAAFEVGGALKNTGEITLPAGQIAAQLLLASDTTLSGGGAVMLASDIDSINSSPPGGGLVTLTNIDNTISGAGLIGNDWLHSMHIVNESKGIISGVTFGRNQHGSKLMVTNNGLLENTYIHHATVNGSGGTILAAGHNVYIGGAGSSITGQTLETETHFSLFTDVDSITISGIVDNAGAINFDNDIVLTGSTTLTGGGRLAVDKSYVFEMSQGIVLTNENNVISGADALNNVDLILINQTAGTISMYNSVLNTGSNTVVNAGVIAGFGSDLVDSPIDNTGIISEYERNEHTMTVAGVVSGAGSATIGAGTLNFQSYFNQNVTFGSFPGELELAQSQAYTATITGFSTSGGTSLDLNDIGFVSAGEASFNGTATSGVLTVGDGTRSAHITLDGDYLDTTFICSSDGHGGVIVTTSSGEAPAAGHLAPAAPHALVSAMAGLAPTHASTGPLTHQPWREAPPMLAAARGQLA